MTNDSTEVETLTGHFLFPVPPSVPIRTGAELMGTNPQP